jgi:hypothetical protein
MQPIPRPEVLDPDRPLTDRRDTFGASGQPGPEERLAKALHESCAYAQQLWEQLAQVRGYLLRCLPDDPQQPEARRATTAPTGPDDEAGWQDWVDTYAAVASVLAGPQGDSGFGVDEAREYARARRIAPVPVRPDAPPTRIRARRRRLRLPWRR